MKRQTSFEQFTDVDYVIPLDIPLGKIAHRIRVMQNDETAEIVGAESEVRLIKVEPFSYSLNRKTGMIRLELVNMAGSAFPSCRDVFLDVAKEIDDSLIAASMDLIVDGLGTSFIFYRKDNDE